MNRKKYLNATAIIALGLLVIFVAVAPGLAAPDLGIEKKVTLTQPSSWTTSSFNSLLPTNPNTFEATNGNQFFYAIKITNPVGSDAADLIMTDKLPSDLANTIVPGNVQIYDGDSGAPYTPPVTTPPTVVQTTIGGDLMYINFGLFPANKVAIVVIQATVPANTAPATWYNSAYVRFKNSNEDPNQDNNAATIRIYIRPPIVPPSTAPYQYFDATKSFDDLLGSQQDLLFSFEDLLHKYIDSGRVPEDSDATYEFITSFEQLLREQSKIESSLVDLLNNHEATGWASTDSVIQNELLNRFETNLRKEAFLLASFEFAIKQSIAKYWADPNVKYDAHTLTIRQELAASFEDLLKRQVTMLREFENLEKNLVTSDPVVKTKFLASFEDLLRLQANLLLSFEDIVKLAFPTGDNTNPPGPVPPYVPMPSQNVTLPVVPQNVTQPVDQLNAT